MTKFFISQPMNGKTNAEIIVERTKCSEWLSKAFGSITIINSFIAEDPPKDCNIPAWYLGESIKALAKADVMVLWGDWENARGCLIKDGSREV